MLLTHRKLLQPKAIAIENDLRGTLRNFGLKVGMVGTVKFEGRIKELALRGLCDRPRSWSSRSERTRRSARVTQARQAASSQPEANALQVRVELQADCLRDQFRIGRRCPWPEGVWHTCRSWLSGERAGRLSGRSS